MLNKAFDRDDLYRPVSPTPVEWRAGRALLITAQGGRVAVDAALLRLWRSAADKTLAEILVESRRSGVPEDETRAMLACLCAAGLLERSTQPASSPRGRRRAGPLVSVVLVGFNSRADLGACLTAVQAQTHNPREILFVDNASEDGSTEWVRTHFPAVHVRACARRVGLAESLNLGAAQARGEYFLFLNPDVSLEETALSEMVAVAEGGTQCAAVAAKLRLAWAPGFLNGIGNSVGAAGWGSDAGLGHLDLGQFDHWREIPSACFAAALISRRAWDAVGPLDDGFPLYYEDSEWCYRARLLGWSILAAPGALGQHTFGGPPPNGAPRRMSVEKLRAVTYGRLRFAAKLLGPWGDCRFIAGYAGEDALGALTSLVRGRWQEVLGRISAWSQFTRDRSHITDMRRALNRSRVLPEARLFSLAEHIPPPLIWRGMPELTRDLIVNTYRPYLRKEGTGSLPEFAGMEDRPRMLVVSQDVVGPRMAGPGLRYLKLARALQPEVHVVLAAPDGSQLTETDLPFLTYSEVNTNELRRMARECEIVLLSATTLSRFPFLGRSGARLVGDLYDPFFIENLHHYSGLALRDQDALHQQALGVTEKLLRCGDFFICGSERQRDFWMGMLAACGRINPRTTEKDPTLRGLVDVVGLGVAEQVRRGGPVLRGVHPAIGARSQIVLWGGGLWDWLDPLTLIHAWPQVIRRRTRARLVFVGTRHPNPLVPLPRMAERARQAAEAIGELERTVFFLDWLPVDDYESLLSEADVGVVLHPLHLETHLSLRTRVFDYFSARLPVLMSSGDVTSDWVRGYGVGELVPPGDAKATGEALVQMLGRPRAEGARKFDRLMATLPWREVATPLRRYCLSGQHAVDGATSARHGLGGPGSWRAALARARFILRNEGARPLGHRLMRYLRWRWMR